MNTLLCAALVSVSCLLVAADFRWNDCASGADTSMTVHSFSLSPYPALLPGDLTVSLNLTVNKQIDKLYLDVILTRVSQFGNVTIPCIAGTDLGTCTNIDACSILGSILNGTSVVSVDLGKQIENILLSALGHDPQCPISPENVVLTNQVFNLKAVPQTLAVITDGDYHVKVQIKTSNATTDNVGCLEFDTGFKRSGTGLLFG